MYESHITIEPVFDERLQVFTDLCTKQRFHVAKLLMVKNRTETVERSNKDSFCTGHSQDYEDILKRGRDLCTALVDAGLRVWRFKIEHIILDEKYERG